jgi:small subunit ribosomal protein S3
LSKAGEPAEKLVSYGYAVATLKPGTVGVEVRIMPPEVPLPDEFKVAEKEAEVKPEEIAVEGEGGEAEGTAEEPKT